MGTTSNVLRNIGTERPFTYRQIGIEMGLLTAPRAYPRAILPNLVGVKLGLHNKQFIEQKIRPSGSPGYYLRVVPIYSGMSDPDGLPLCGTPIVESTQPGTTFEWEPFPDGYACDGYRIYAASLPGQETYQGTIMGRFNTKYICATTFPYTTTGALLSEQTLGVPAFATALEVYQPEGAIDSRTFFGGGKEYTDGYAKVSIADEAPVLTAGWLSYSDPLSWHPVTNGSFRMRLAWKESVTIHSSYPDITTVADFDSYFDFSGLNFSSAASFADVAAVVQAAIRAAQAPILYGGTTPTTVAVLKTVTNGAFDFFSNGTVYHVTAVDLSSGNSFSDMAALIQTRMQVVLATATCTYTAGRFVFMANVASPDANHTLSYLYQNSNLAGIDLSKLLDADENSTTAVLNRKGKAATTETVTVGSSPTDYMIITGSTTGGQYKLSYLETHTLSVGTDISNGNYIDARSTDCIATYLNGAKARRTVRGTGTNWGSWAIGMKFRFLDESFEYIVEDVIDSETLLLDSDYSGGSTVYPKQYILTPFDNQLYFSALGNPFKVDDATNPNIVPLPTADGDSIVAIRRLGRNVAVFMKHHLWIVDGVDIKSPRMISNFYGVPNPDCIVEYANGLAFFSGKDFYFLDGQSVQQLDPEGRMRDILSRLSPNNTYHHGQYLQEDGVDIIKWFVSLDNSYKINTALVLYPKEGMWTLENVKDANCSAMIRDANGVEHLITGSTYDTNNSIPSFTFLHGKEYLNDGASQDPVTTKQGIVGTVGAAVATAGYLTCGTYTYGSITATKVALFNSISAGYFSITIDDIEYNVGPIDFTAASGDLPTIAALIQTAIQAKTGRTESCVWDSTEFVITSSTTTNRSNVSYLRPYIPNSAATDLTAKKYLNGWTGSATKTGAVTTRVLTLQDMTAGTPALDVVEDGEKGIYVYVCDSQYRNGQYALISSNNATTITITPDFAQPVAAGWFWYIGGIVPIYTKWFDYGSPQHKQKLYAIDVTVKPENTTNYNFMTIHGMQDLNTAIRTSKTNQIGNTADTVQTFKLQDKESTQTGFRIIRPSSLDPLHIEDITLIHSPRV